MWSLPVLVAAIGLRLARRGPLRQYRQRLREGRPRAGRHGVQRAHRRGAGAGEPARVTRPAPVAARRPALSSGADQDRSRDGDARAEIRGLRAQWRSKREEIKSALSQQVYAQAGLRAAEDLAERKFASTQRLEEARRDLDVARQRISAARRTCCASRRRWPAIPRSASTTIPRSSR